MIAALGIWLTPTRAIGSIAFGCAAAASGLAWARLAAKSNVGSGRKSGGKAAWPLPMTLTLIHSLLFLDILFNWRWKLHDFLRDTAIADSVYSERSLPQTVALLCLGVGVAVVSLILVRRLWNRKGALLAFLGTWIGVASWCMEVVSLHAVDAVLYRTKGPFMPVVAVWILVGLMTTAGVTLYARAISAEAVLKPSW